MSARQTAFGIIEHGIVGSLSPIFVIGIWFVPQAGIIHFVGLSYLLFVFARKRKLFHLRKARLVNWITFRFAHIMLLVKNQRSNGVAVFDVPAEVSALKNKGRGATSVP